MASVGSRVEGFSIVVSRKTREGRIQESEVDRALDAMTAPEVRAAVRVVLSELRVDARTSAIETLVARLEANITLAPHRRGGAVEEVLGVDAQACVAQYATCVYTTTPLGDRADALSRASGPDGISAAVGQAIAAVPSVAG